MNNHAGPHAFPIWQVRAHMVQGKGALEMPRELQQSAHEATHERQPQPQPPNQPPRDLPQAAANAQWQGVVDRAQLHAPIELNAEIAAAGHAGAVPEGPGESSSRKRPAGFGGVNQSSDATRRVQAAAAQAALRATYSPAESQRAFKHIVDFHTKEGWTAQDALRS